MEQNHFRILHELYPLLLQSVQSVVRVHCRHFLYFKTSGELRDYRHVLHRNEFQENDASLYDFCGHYRINDLYAKFVLPKGSVTRLNFEDRYIKPKKQNTARNVQLEVDSGVIAYIDNYNNAMKTGNRFSLDKFVDKKLVSHLTARRVTYDTTTVHKWTIHDYMIRELDGLKEKITKGDRIDSIINMEPSDFLIMKNQQEMLTSPQLSDYIEKQKRRGFANIKEFEIEYHKRIAMSFASFILTIIGVSLSSRKTKGGMGLHLGIGLGLSFSYILFQTITSTFAINGNVPPVIAVWIPNILYAGIAFFLYQKAPK